MATGLGKWIQFAKERFDPPSHSLMISAFLLSHFLLNHRSVEATASAPQIWHFALLFLGATAFFFKLRLYDEIKDFEVDCKINQTRPLVRGLVSHKDLYQGIVICTAIELLTFGSRGPEALVGIGIAIVYSLLMFKEFFIPNIIRPHLTTYAVSHTFVCCILTIALFCALRQQFPWELDSTFLLFALNSWFLFNVFEFGRKTFTTAEERENVESYSRIFGRFGAVILVLIMAGASFGMLWLVELSLVGQVLLGASFLLLTVTSLLYAILNKAPYGRLYRGMSSAYIVLIYLAFIIENLNKHFAK